MAAEVPLAVVVVVEEKAARVPLTTPRALMASICSGGSRREMRWRWREKVGECKVGA